MKKRSMVGLAIWALMAALLPGVASADAVGACPGGGGWNLVGLNGVIERDVGNKRDRNGDGYVCQRDNRGLDLDPDDPEYGGTWTVKDNTNRLGRYRVVGEGLNWHDAVDYCESIDAHLVTIESRQEDRRVFRLMPGTWLGATDEAVEDTWVWVTGLPLEPGYTNWAPGEPNDAHDPDWAPDGEDYATYTESGTWNDISGDNDLPFVCESE